jgi:AcrR family transcriptional regulator
MYQRSGKRQNAAKTRAHGSRTAVKHHGGRPTLAEAQRRQERLLDVAGAMFMELGYDGTSIDAVAEGAGMSKRTVYARYADKSALFRAVLRRLIERWLAPLCQFEASTAALEPTLKEIGRHLLTSALAPGAVRLHRILVAEAERQPGFGALAHDEGMRPAIRAIATILRRHAERLNVTDFERAAEQFVSLAIDHNLRLATLGIETPQREIETRVEAAVDLFLAGTLRR